MSDFLVGPYIGFFAMFCGLGLFVFVAAILFYGMYRTAKKDRDHYANAIPATARVISVDDSDVSSGGIDLELTLEVTPPNGIPYQVSSNWSVEPLSISKIQAGSILPVKIDVKNPKIIYPVDDWAWGYGKMPSN